MIRKLVDLQLGERFRYAGHQQVYVLIGRHGCGLVAHAPAANASPAFQGIYSAADSPEQMRSLEVFCVPIVDAS